MCPSPTGHASSTKTCAAPRRLTWDEASTRHTRDEAGFDDEGGHTQMWYGARDVAFEHPVTADETAVLLERMGIAVPGSGGKIDVERMRAGALASRVLPADVDFDLETLIARMTSLLFIEIQAFRVRLGRGGAIRHRASRGRRRGGSDHLLHTSRRDTARRLPQDRAHRTARPDGDR